MALVVGGWVAFATPAEASKPLPATCTNGWYVNDDEGNLMPTQTQNGLVFDGPSLIHHAASGFFHDAPSDGYFVVKGAVTGNLPLFKMETYYPYSTVNKASGGWWSSKIATGAGSQSSPVPTIAALSGLAPYTGATVLISFGVGYANDSGNKATISAIVFNGHKYDMTCVVTPPHKPVPVPTKTSASPSPSATSPTTATPRPTDTGTPVPVAATGSLPVTGPGVSTFVIAGGVVMLAGAGLFWATRRRRNTFEA
jgi:LPXTG-motif cell wall-anchored protein